MTLFHAGPSRCMRLAARRLSRWESGQTRSCREHRCAQSREHSKSLRGHFVLLDFPYASMLNGGTQATAPHSRAPCRSTAARHSGARGKARMSGDFEIGPSADRIDDVFEEEVPIRGK